jgi:hypothetical protein
MNRTAIDMRTTVGHRQRNQEPFFAIYVRAHRDSLSQREAISPGAMTSWSGILALSGFHYSGVTGVMEFTAKTGTYFWSNGYAWGTCKVTSDGAELKVLHGSLKLSALRLSDGREKKMIIRINHPLQE